MTAEEFEIPYWEPKIDVFQAVKLRFDPEDKLRWAKVDAIRTWSGWKWEAFQEEDSFKVGVEFISPDGDIAITLPAHNDKNYLVLRKDQEVAELWDASEFEDRYCRLDGTPVMEEVEEVPGPDPSGYGMTLGSTPGGTFRTRTATGTWASSGVHATLSYKGATVPMTSYTAVPVTPTTPTSTVELKRAADGNLWTRGSSDDEWVRLEPLRYDGTSTAVDVENWYQGHLDYMHGGVTPYRMRGADLGKAWEELANPPTGEPFPLLKEPET